MKILQIIIGIILLLPGICSAFFMAIFGSEAMLLTNGGGFYIIWLPSFAVSIFGIWLIFNTKNRK